VTPLALVARAGGFIGSAAARSGSRRGGSGFVARE
jgi:hypothetical protein